jgi:hypothetical protein
VYDAVGEVVEDGGLQKSSQLEFRVVVTGKGFTSWGKALEIGKEARGLIGL